MASAIEPRRVIGSLAYFSTDIVEPGVIRHTEGNRISFGEPDGTRSDRIRRIAETLIGAGFRCPITTRIRHEIWVKLLGNVAFNPISALTHATLVDICQFPPTRALAERMMREAQEIGEKLGVRFPVSLEKRIAGAEAVGKHKTSMLQDVESGRPLELDALVGSVIELGRITGVPTPNLTAVHACVALLAKTLHDERGRLRIER